MWYSELEESGFQPRHHKITWMTGNFIQMQQMCKTIEGITGTLIDWSTEDLKQGCHLCPLTPHPDDHLMVKQF